MNAKEWYDASYSKAGYNAQRKYPNEELCRFIGGISPKGHNLSVLEVGCGSGSNLWMLAEQGYNVTGLDISPESLRLSQQLLKRRNLSATLVEGAMQDLPFEDNSFDLVVDVFSSYCLVIEEFQKYLMSAYRVLRDSSLLFIYTPSKKSDAFLYHSPSKLIDESTLDGIKRKDSPYAGNEYPFRFSSPREICHYLENCSFRIINCERISRTYSNGSEYFEYLTIQACKD